MSTTIRFRYISDQDDLIYVGEAEIDTDNTVSLIEVWEMGTTLEEVFPYDTKFPIVLRRQLETAALEARTTPPAIPIQLPSEMDGFQVESIETTYTISVRLALPNVRTDEEVKFYGLSTVKRIIPGEGSGKYKVTAIGGISDVRRELYRIRLF